MRCEHVGAILRHWSREDQIEDDCEQQKQNGSMSFWTTPREVHIEVALVKWSGAQPSAAGRSFTIVSDVSTPTSIIDVSGPPKDPRRIKAE